MARDWHSVVRAAALGPRLATVLVGLPLLLAALWLGGGWWTVVIGALTIVGALEFTRLHPTLGDAARATVVVGSIAAMAVVAWSPAAVAPWLLGAAGAAVVGVGILPVLMKSLPHPLAWLRHTWATVALGIAYLGGPTGVLIRWRQQMTIEMLAWFLVIVWGNDIAAYFVGVTVGRHKLAPRISPGKSWEGAVAALAVAAAIGAGVGSTWGLSAAVGAVFGGATSVVSQVGDLFKSTMKRRAGVKDSGTLLPGHGGVLDRFDGLLFAAPFGYLLLSAWSR